MDPVAATAAGVQAFDDRLGGFQADDVAAYISAHKSLTAALEECDVSSLDEEIDRTALLDDLRFTIYRFEREQPHVKNPTFWLSQVLEGLYFLLTAPDRTPEHCATAAAARVRDIPGFLDAAQQTLRDCPRVFVETAIRVAAQGHGLLREIEVSLAPEGDEGFARACEDARKAISDFSVHLETEFGEDGDAPYAIGEDGFNFRLHFQHALRGTAPELWRYGLAVIEHVEHDLEVLAKEIDSSVAWVDLADRLRCDHPASNELVAAYTEQMQRALNFVEERDLVSVPSGPLEVVATPPFLRPLIPFAAYQPPGAFSEARQGRFYVTDPDPDSGDQTIEQQLRAHSAYDLPSTALHEGYPGHHLQFLTAHAQQSNVRKVISTPLTVEGWALYCEEMMREEGFYACREERLFQKMALLWRACRIVVDVGLHTRGMTFGEAVDFMVGHLHFERPQAEAEVRRYCAEPAYQLCYAVGMREIKSLREAYAASKGSDYSLKQFHDTVLAYGGLPVSLIRWGLGLDA
jgi:hypothetical protein